jgi:hypothetical protein
MSAKILVKIDEVKDDKYQVKMDSINAFYKKNDETMPDVNIQVMKRFIVRTYYVETLCSLVSIHLFKTGTLLSWVAYDSRSGCLLHSSPLDYTRNEPIKPEDYDVAMNDFIKRMEKAKVKPEQYNNYVQSIIDKLLHANVFIKEKTDGTQEDITIYVKANINNINAVNMVKAHEQLRLF